MSAAYPSILDGAGVRLVASVGHLRRNPEGARHSVKNFENVVAYLAVARYDEDSEAYLFYCTDEWDVVTDTYHDSEVAAIGQAELEFPGVVFIPLQS